MVKSLYDYTSHIFTPCFVDVPKPPPLPEYKPGDEKTYWNYRRIAFGITDVEGREQWTRTGDIPKEDDKPDWRGVIRKNVIELPMPGKYNFGQRQDTNYFFFDTPDYADPFKKLWWANRFFLKTGLVLWGLVGIFKGYKFTWQNNMWLFQRTLRPWYVGGMLGTMAVLTISNLRGKKDDYYNYALAGLLAGSYLGRENHVKWFRYSMVWTPMAIIAKYAAEANIVLFPHDNPGRGRTINLAGNSTEHGFKTGDIRPQIAVWKNDPGRDQRTISH